ncbi:hypothetical protein AC578_960 [Pseudocercospora eumusae]|uniref:F-box domain-containing protein n=1 Tax=Pseudocercospora eumusae TaxID=321146 RepID=A0A139HEM3_9PEZI|nr:hypothetical protein AC578_960 [Pseudocercospora eumusae]
MSSIAVRVFAVAELLELILLQLPMKDILVHQRTCKAVCDAVAGPEALKKKLFLLPAGPVIEPIDNDAESKSWTLSCLEYPSVNVKFNPATLVERMAVDSGQIHEDHRTSYDLGAWPPAVVSVDEFYFTSHWKIEIHVIPAKRQSWDRGVLTDGATWRNMFLTQPPISAISFCNDYINAIKAAVEPWEIHEPFLTFWNPTGLRIGDLHREVRELQDRYPNPESYGRGDYSLDAFFNCGYAGDRKEDFLTRLIGECKGVLGRNGSCDCIRKLWKEDLPEDSEEMKTLLRLCKEPKF